MNGRLAAVACGALLLGACGTPNAQLAPAPPPPTLSRQCDATPVQFAVGRAHSQPLAEEVRQKSGSATARALRPGQIVTQEFNPERVTLDLDANGVVIRVRCG